MSRDYSKAFTYTSFDLEMFKDEKEKMENFRRNCFGENLEEKWRTIQREYLPLGGDGRQIDVEYITDPLTGIASPDVYRSSEDEEVYHFIEPAVSVKVHTALSILTSRTPNVRWDSDDSRYDQNVPIINALRDRDWQDEQTRSQYVMFWYYDILYGTTYWRRYFEHAERDVFLPSKIDLTTDKVEFEKTTVVEIDSTVGEALSPMSVWIDPDTQPLCPRSMRKVMWEKVYDYEKFIDRFKGEKSEKWLRENVLPTSSEDGGGEGKVICRFYEHKDLDLLYVCANNDIEILKTHLPQNHKDLSIMMAIWMPRGDKNPYGLGPIEMMLPDKRALDEFKSMTLTQTKFSVYKAMFYTGSLQTDGGESGEIKLRPDRAYKVSEKPTFMEMPGPGADAWNAISMLRERIDDASGINRPLGGEIVKTTAFQTDLAKDAALARLAVPIANVVNLLAHDAELTFELQKQHYTLPKIEELVEPQDIIRARAELADMQMRGETPDFDIWVDETKVDEEGTITPKVYRGEYRSVQLNVEKNQGGEYIPSLGKRSTVLTPDLMEWRGKIHVIADSILSITPTLERTRKLEMFNLLIPMFGKPPDMVAKPAAAIVKLYGEQPEEILPDMFVQYLKSIQEGAPPAQGSDQPFPGVNGRPPDPVGGMPPGGGNQDGALQFQQEGAPTVVTNMGGQKDMISAASEQLGQ